MIEGKTKVVKVDEKNPDECIIWNKDTLTAGNGAKCDVLRGKGALSNRTNANVMRLLAQCGIPVAFLAQIDDVSSRARMCRMLPWEVVVRREAHGSYLKRNPSITKGQLFPKLICEFYLKTTGKVWEGQQIPVDDPFVVRGDDIRLYRPDEPIASQEPFLTLPKDFLDHGEMATMIRLAKRTFLVLERAWQLLGYRYVDFKVEFGIDTSGRILLADVIDNDSGRLIGMSGEYEDKQAYRDGGSLDDVLKKYDRVARLTDRFALPRQHVICWRASIRDPIEPYGTALQAHLQGECVIDIQHVVCSAHKEPARAVLIVQQMAHAAPDSVIIAIAGKSNALGPMLSTQVSVPVITVPADAASHPENVASSVNMPSAVPVLTICDPANAVLAALRILAVRNPYLYMLLRERAESEFVNIVQI